MNIQPQSNAAGPGGRFALKPLVVSLAAMLAAPQAMTQTVLPAGANVVHGQAAITTQGNRMTVTSSANAILNWQSFSIGAGSSVRFDQPNSSSQVLNRVLGNNPTAIFGSLSSNGRVWLLNPNGVLFGPTARVDVAGLVASTLNISDADWQAQRYNLLAREMPAAGGGDAAVVNQGELRSTTGGRLMLIGGAGGVRNEGLIEAPGGQVVLAAGRSIDLGDSTMPDIAVRVSAPQSQVLNLGSLGAAGGRVDLLGAMVNQSGIVRADALAGGQGGTIVLRSSDTTLVSGSISASADSGQGGRVQLLGPQVGLLDGASVNVSGSRGGGDIFVGGGLQGRDPSVLNARSVYFGAGASLLADATDKGSGGNIFLWSDQATRAYGRLSARGGAQGGDGGFIETSGGWLDARPASVRTDAPRGRAGTWLLDPNDVLITDFFSGSSDNENVTSGPDFTTTGDNALIYTYTIADALNAGNNVSITTASPTGHSQPGDVTFSSAHISVNPSQAVSLSVNADRGILVQGSAIVSSGAPLNVSLSAGRSGPGGVRISGSSIQTAGGSITAGGPQAACGAMGCSPFTAATGRDEDGWRQGVSVSSSTLTAGAGKISLRGASALEDTSHYGVVIDSGSVLSARDVKLEGWVGSSSPVSQIGVKVNGTLTATHSIALDGTSVTPEGAGGENTFVGVLVNSTGSIEVDPSSSDPSASLKIVGRSDIRSGNWDDSVSLSGAVRVSGSASADIQGFGGGISVGGSSPFDAAAAGSLSFSGSGFLYVGGDILVPNGGTFSISNTPGVSFYEGEVSGSPSSVTIDSPAGSVDVGGGYYDGSANLNFGSAPVNIRAAAFNMGASGGFGSISAGRILIRANAVVLDEGASEIYSNASGDAITFAGLSGNVSTFTNIAGVEVLAAPNGRWLVFGTDPRDSANFNDGGLFRDFTQYNATYGTDSPVGAGNGVLFSFAPTATLSAPLSAAIAKVYDGDKSVPGFNTSSVSLTGLLPGDSKLGGLSVSGASFAQKDVGNNIPVNIDLKVPPAIIDSNQSPVYGYRFKSDLSGSITPRPLTVSGVDVANKVYDGSRVADVTGATLSGLVGSETLGFKPGTGQFDTKDVGKNKPVTATVTLLNGENGGLAGNYQLTGGNSVSAKADITPRPVDVGALLVTPKVYDGNTSATVSAGAVLGTVSGETLTLSVGAGQFDTKDAGLGKKVTAPITLVDGTGQASNYSLSQPLAQGLGNITPRTVAVTGIVADNKVYDGTKTASLSGGVFTGLVGSETLSLASTGSFDTQDVGTGKTVTAILSLADGANGGLAGNYRLDATAPVTTTADVTPKLVTVSGLSAVTRNYDGTRNVTLAGTGSLVGLVGSEQLGFRLGSGSFDTKDAGVGKTVTASLLLSDGANGGKAGNYALADAGAATFLGTINPKPLTIAGVSAADKVYDGSTSASVTVASVQGFVAGESLVVGTSGQFVDKNAGAGKSVKVVLSLQDGSGGGLASNYSLADLQRTTTATIERRPVSLSGVAAQDKVYDGTRTATLGAGSINGLVPGESLTIGGNAQFGDKSVGTNKPVTGTLALADGSGGGLASNYSLSGSADFAGTAAIKPKPLDLASATAADKVYDSTTTASVGSFVLIGVLPGEQVTVAAGNGRFDNANVGVGKPVTATATALGGPDAGNYGLGVASVLTRASISPATLSYVAESTIRPVGQAPIGLSGSVSGFVGSDSLASATSGVLGFVTPAGAASPEGEYPVFGQGLSASNYVFVQSPANGTALSLVNVPTGLGDDVGAQTQVAIQQLNTLLPTPGVSSPTSNRVADALQTLVVGSGSGAGSSSGATFRSIDLASLTLDDTAALLSARDRYKRAIFADALSELERDPSLADVPSCQTVEQAAAGNCLITEALKPALRARILQQQSMPAPTAAVPPPVVAQPPVAAAPAAPPAVAAAPVPPPAVAMLRPTLPITEPRIELPARRAVRSAAVPQIQRKFALVIGIDNYVDGRIPKLDNAVSDAAAVGAVLEKSLGYQAVVVRDGSKQTILAAFNQLAAQVSPDDSVVIYYAGHGELVEKSGLGYWQPASADASKPETWISNSDIGKLLGQLTASQVALISDSCFSGSLVSDERIRGIPAGADPTALLSRRAVVVMSSGGNEPVFDSGKNGHSTFAWNLMRTIEKVSTWRPGSAVFEQVRFAVAKELPQRPQYGASRLGGHQAGSDYLFEQRQLDGGPR